MKVSVEVNSLSFDKRLDRMDVTRAAAFAEDGGINVPTINVRD